MSDIAIRVEGTGKRYQLGAIERYRTLRDTLTDAVKAPFRRGPLLRVSVAPVVTLLVGGLGHVRRMDSTFADVV